jgi:oxaloacetate decarboxylase beta subunit
MEAFMFDFLIQFDFLLKGFKVLAENPTMIAMWAIGGILIYLAIKKEYEPLLLLPIAFGMILSNLPGAGLFDSNMWNNEFLNPNSPNYHSYGYIMAHGGLLDVLYIGVKAGIYPCLIFLGVGAMTDFGPLIANPKSLLLGAAAQLGIFATFLVTQIDVFGFTAAQSASIGIIGGADGPTAIFVTASAVPGLQIVWLILLLLVGILGFSHCKHK